MDPDSIVVRPFQPADLPQVHAIFAAGMRHYHAGIPADEEGREEKIARWNSYIDESLADDLGANFEATYGAEAPRSGFYCAVEGGEGGSVVLGIVGAECQSEAEVELRRMSVTASARGLGLGARLVAAVEEHARRHGFTTVVLSTGGSMGLAVRLYQSCGYAREDTERGGVLFRKSVTGGGGGGGGGEHTRL